MYELLERKRFLLKSCMIFVCLLSAWMTIDGIYLIYKGATSAGIMSFVVAIMNLAWVKYYLAEMRNVSLQFLVETQQELIKLHDKLRYEFFDERRKDIVLFNKRSEATAEELEKIIELSQKRMVNGLPEERYTCFINEVLHAIHGFAERAKHNLLNRTYEVKEDEKV